MNTLSPQALKLRKVKTPHADHKYLNALVSNDMKLVEEIYTRCSKSIISMVKKNNGDESDAKDVFQETLISIYRQANNGFVLTCPLEQFVYMACKRKWINTLKKKKLDYKGDFNDVLLFEKAEDQLQIINKAVEDEERSLLVQQKFKQLGPSCKEIIKLSWTKKDDGKYHSWKEIAEELDLSYGYVRKKAAECKERLINLVKKDPGYTRLL